MSANNQGTYYRNRDRRGYQSNFPYNRRRVPNLPRNEVLDLFTRNRCPNYFKYGTCKVDCPKLHVIINKRNIAKWFKNAKELLVYDKYIKKYDFNNNILIEKRVVTATRGKKEVIRGAGIVPVAKVPGAMYVLFGYEANESRGKRYSLFTGRRDARYDKHCLQTAIRKFCEETYGVFDQEGHDPVKCFQSSYAEIMKNLGLIRIQSIIHNCIMFALPIDCKFMLYPNLLGDAKEYHEKRWKNAENRPESMNLIKLDFKWIEWQDIKLKYLKGIKTSVTGEIYGISAPLNAGDLSFLKGMMRELDLLYEEVEILDALTFVKPDTQVKEVSNDVKEIKWAEETGRPKEKMKLAPTNEISTTGKIGGSGMTKTGEKKVSSEQQKTEEATTSSSSNGKWNSYSAPPKTSSGNTFQIPQKKSPPMSSSGYYTKSSGYDTFQPPQKKKGEKGEKDEK